MATKSINKPKGSSVCAISTCIYYYGKAKKDGSTNVSFHKEDYEMTNTDSSTKETMALPPITNQFPQWSRSTLIEATHFESPISSGGHNTVEIKKIVTKKCPDLMLGRTEGLLFPSMSADPLLRITQLEQNLRFLQEQHQIMLASLHQEIECLRQRNRDLQFQLVFSKGGISILHSGSDSSSPEEDSKPKVVLSPKQCNTRPLQVEILEKDVSELRTALNEAQTNNAALNALLDQHKKQLEATRTCESQITDYESRLEDAEKLIRRLRKENDDQRREISSFRSNTYKGNTNGGRHPSGGRRGGGGGGQQDRFPPLHSQSYWHQSQQGRTRTSPDFPSQSNGGGSQRKGMERAGEIVGQAAPTLPHLNRNYGQPSGSNGRARYYSNGNHYNNYRGGGDGEGGRKYRGGRGNREPENQ